jgi:hypothetical protein
MITLKNVSTHTLIIRDDSIEDLQLQAGQTHEFDDSIAERLLVINSPFLEKYSEAPIEEKEEVIEKPIEKEVVKPKEKKKVIKIKKGKK